MNQSMSLLLWIYKSKANNKGLAPIFLRITSEGVKKEISTGISVLPERWDSKKGIIKGSSNSVKETNKSLNILFAKALKIFNEMQERQTPASAEQIKAKLLGTDDDVKTILQAFTYHNNLFKSKIGVETSKATYTKFETVKKKITLFVAQKMNRKDIFLKELDHRFIVEFEAFLKIEQKLSHNPTIKYIQALKKVIHLSISNGGLAQNPFSNFKYPLINKDRKCLSPNGI